MKKMIVPVILVSLIGIYIYKNGISELFTPGAVKKVRTQTIDEFEKAAREDESEYLDRLNSAEKVAMSHETLGKKYAERKSWTPAIVSLKKALEYGQSGSNVHYWLGVAYANRGSELNSLEDYKSAEIHYSKAIEISKDLVDAKYGLAILKFYKLNDQKGAVNIMKGIVNTRPQYYDGSFALARFYYETGLKSKSLNTYESLYSILEKKNESFHIKALKERCRENISQLNAELSGR